MQPLAASSKKQNCGFKQKTKQKPSTCVACHGCKQACHGSLSWLQAREKQSTCELVVNLQKQGKTIFKQAGKKLFTCACGDKQEKQNNTQPVRPVTTTSKTKPCMQDKMMVACREERTINLSTCESSSWISKSRGEQSSSRSKQVFTCAHGCKQKKRTVAATSKTKPWRTVRKEKNQLVWPVAAASGKTTNLWVGWWVNASKQKQSSSK